ncbi:hypothetical protein KCU88_g7187, partial [Aureobasidium melanogenum]
MLRRSNDLSSDFFPIDAVVQLFIHQSHNSDIVTSYKVQAMADLRAGFWVIGGTDDALDGVVQDDVGDLVAGEEGADECATVNCDDEHLFCEHVQSVVYSTEVEFERVLSM